MCVYVVQNTQQTLSSCHNTGQIPRCSRLVMRYCGFWTPVLFSLLMPLPHPCLLRHSSLSRILRPYFNLISSKQLCSLHQSAATSGQSLQYALQASLSHFTALYSSPWYSSSRACVLSVCVLSPEQGRVGGPIRTFCICHLLFLACSCIFFLSSFSTFTGKHTNVRCLSSRPFPREGVLLSRDSKADMSQITRQIELF